MNIAKFLFGSSTPKRKSKKTFREIYQSLYPESVRYALQYREADLGKNEMYDLLGKYDYEVVYLVVKAYSDDRELQRRYIQDLVRLYVNPDWTRDELRDLLRTHIALLPEDTYVKGTKLAQLNRYGSDHWINAFKEMAENMYENYPESLPCLIAHTPFLAFHHFIRVYSQNPDIKVLILVPGWMEFSEDNLMGYEVVFGDNPSVYYQEKDDCLFGEWECYKHECPLQHRYCGSAIFVDDTINTGSTAGKLENFWYSEYGLAVPEDRIRVITDLRGRGYKKIKPRE